MAETWELWYPDGGATGLPIARARIDPTDVLWAHALPERLAVTVRDSDERVIAKGEPLERVGPRYPMTRLAKIAGRIARDDRWPTDADLGSLVILPGGEVGTLTAWWNAPDGSEWRWRIELYNHR
ncbi:MAG TPA: hypothetical protein VNF73_03370 [Candidatus Saccharimonadales bacterium]|nr:hypothetical protein [Candidatus Saccharimonadales bacterium]